MNLGMLFTRHARYRPDHTAVVFGDQRLTHLQFNQQINRLANALVRLGLKKGSKIATVLPNCLELLETYWASAKVGAVVVPMSTLLRESALRSLLQDADAEMLAYRDRNVGQVADVAAIYHKVLETDRVAHVLALQPMFRNSKKKRTPMEEKIESVTGMQKIGFYDAGQTYDVLVQGIKKRCQEAGCEVLDLTGIFDNVTEWVFTDWCHLTNGANFILAKALVNRVKTSVFGLELSESDVLKEPLDAYFVDYARNARVFVGNEPAEGGLNILKGYPGPGKLEVDAKSAAVFPDGIPAVVLDFGAVVPLSRLRIVWGSEAAVPDEWWIDVSSDGQTWRPWYHGKDVSVDYFDQWPGYEYYAAAEDYGRFVRYRPSPNQGKGISLRQISLFK